MHERHRPDKRFVDNLEWQLGSELRRRQRAGSPPATGGPGRLLRTAALVIVSVAFGAVAMAGTQRIEQSWRAELMEESLRTRLELESQRVQMLDEALAKVQEQFRLGVVGRETLAVGELQLADAEARLKTVELELDELRLGRLDPRDDIGAPLVGGRDFVRERLEVQADLLRRRFELARVEFEETERRNALGVADEITLGAARMWLREMESEIVRAERRIDLRRQLVAGSITPIEAELRIMDADTDERSQALQQRLELARQELAGVETRVAVGTLSPETASAYRLQLAELEAELRLAEIERQIVLRELRERRR